jgi:hypothetical protein
MGASNIYYGVEILEKDYSTLKTGFCIQALRDLPGSQY